MYNGMGLKTARSSGTNGYTQANKFSVKHSNYQAAKSSSIRGFDGGQGIAGVSGMTNKEMLVHNRKRQVELKLIELEEKLLEQGYTEAEVADKLREARDSLEASAAAEAAGDSSALIIGAKVSETDTQKAAQKEQALATLKDALGIGANERKH